LPLHAEPAYIVSNGISVNLAAMVRTTQKSSRRKALAPAMRRRQEATLLQARAAAGDAV
jgi:hypothetical protein